MISAATVPVFSSVHWALGTTTGIGAAYFLYNDIKAGVELNKVKTEISKLEQKLDEL